MNKKYLFGAAILGIAVLAFGVFYGLQTVTAEESDEVLVES